MAIIKGKKKVTGKAEVLGMVDSYAKDIGMLMVDQFATLLQKKFNPLKKLVQAGNLKIPKTTAIFNMASASECPSLKLGLCKAIVVDKTTGVEKNVCYAMKAERSYRPDVLPYRTRQSAYWLLVEGTDFAIDFIRMNATKRNKFTKLRVNEAGDFHDQECVDKMELIAKILLKFGVTTYCYTSRDDLDFTKVKNLVVNASGFEKKGIPNEFKMIGKDEAWPKGYAKCPTDCRVCDRCSVRGMKSFVIEH